MRWRTFPCVQSVRAAGANIHIELLPAAGEHFVENQGVCRMAYRNYTINAYLILSAHKKQNPAND